MEQGCSDKKTQMKFSEMTERLLPDYCLSQKFGDGFPVKLSCSCRCFLPGWQYFCIMLWQSKPFL